MGLFNKKNDAKKQEGQKTCNYFEKSEVGRNLIYSPFLLIFYEIRCFHICRPAVGT